VPRFVAPPAEDEGDGGNLDGPEHDHGESCLAYNAEPSASPWTKRIGVLAEEERRTGPGQRRPQLFAHAMRNREPTPVPVATRAVPGCQLPRRATGLGYRGVLREDARLQVAHGGQDRQCDSGLDHGTDVYRLTATSMDRSDRGSPGRSRTQSALPSMSRHSVSAQRAVRQGPRQNCLRERQAMSRRVTFSLMEGPIAEDDGDPRSLRVSDRERDHAVGRLKDAVSEGLIDIEEFGDRTSQALVARTRGELDAVTSDLPAGADAGREPMTSSSSKAA